MTVYLHKEDLPSDVQFSGAVAVDTEAMGLNIGRDRLCVVQLSDGNGDAHLVQFGPDSEYDAPNLKALLSDPEILKIFHYARFDIALLKLDLEVDCAPIYCTKIVSRLVRTYTDRHGLKDLCRECVGVELSKQQQSSDWGQEELTEEQKNYAASDVLYLHAIKEKLDAMLIREKRVELAQSCFDFLPIRAELDLHGWENLDIFSH